MIGNFTSERKAHTVGTNYKTERRSYVAILTKSERVIYARSVLSLHSKRKALYDNGFRQSQRFCATRFFTEKTQSSRRCFTPPAVVNHCIRVCCFVPGKQALVSTTVVALSIQYNSDRYGYTYTFSYTQRSCLCIIEIYTEANIVVSAADEHYVNTPVVSVSMEYYSSRKVMLPLGDTSQRACIYTTVVCSMRSAVAQNHSRESIYTPVVKTTLIHYSERSIHTKTVISFTQRLSCYASGFYTSERRIITHITFITERTIHVENYIALEIISPVVIQARPEWSSRICFTSMFDYHSERFGFAEKRPLKKVTYPTQSPDILLPFYTQDKAAQMKLKVQRSSEILTEGGNPLGVESSVFHQAFTIKGEDSASEIIISGVDNTGAAISLYRDVKKEFLYSTSLQVIIHDHIERYTERTCYLTYVIPTLVIFSKVVK